MRNKKLMAKLTEDAKGIVFPTYDEKFARLSSAIKDVIRDHFPVRDSISYDDTRQDFYWEESDLVGFIGQDAGDKGGTAIYAKRVFHVNPKLPIADEIARVAREHVEMEQVMSTLKRFVLQNGGSL